MTRPKPGSRAEYRYFHLITTRWMDNDVFRHVNNVVYFSFFDTAVTYWELMEGGVDLVDGDVHCVVAEVACRYHASVAFPDKITVGLRVARLGTSSVRYELAIFRNDEDMASAEGHFVHVFVRRADQRPVPIPPTTRARLEQV
ncbi:MAG: acyl-CoA thioesterase [Acetobacteraceae bacterium]|nr:acyl-CoA thioesterase [Acetobacteraceae bacterium]MSP29156.1 acyl-CoA thioesterase [Acetobacteraceae bacterium]